MPEEPVELLSPALLARLERVELATRRIFRGRMKGERRSNRQGESVEFADFRNYVPGDDLRHIDWNLYARLDKLFLKLFLEEEDLHFFALIDSSLSMGFGEPTKLHVAKQLAAALGYIGLTRSDRVRVESLQAATGRGSPPALRGKKDLWRMLAGLGELEPDGTVDLLAGVKGFALRNPGKGILVLISDLMDKSGYQSALRFLVAQQYDVYVLQVLALEELQPELQGDLRLIDCEDGDAAEITVTSALLDQYQQTVTAFTGGVREFCTRRGMNYLLVNNQQPVDQVVLGYLRARGLVR